MAHFHGWSLTASRLQSHYEEAVYFLPQVSWNAWHSFDQPRKDERLSQLWSHPVVLNTNILLHNRCSNTFSHARNVGGEIVRLEIWQQFEKSSLESFLCPGIPFAIFGNSSQREEPRGESDNQYTGQFTGRSSLFPDLRIQPTKFSFPTH